MHVENLYFLVLCRISLPKLNMQGLLTVNKKMSYEVGAYVWMQEKCPNIRIPYLHGFGFTDGRYVSFT